MTGPKSSGTVQLCEPCSRIDFRSIFTSHRRPVIEKYPMEPTYYYYYYYYRPVGQAQDPTCNCFDTLNARRRHGWPALGDLTATACAFCAFYLECQIRSKDMKERGEKGFGLEGFHSLEGFRLRHADENEKENDFPSRECVQDVTAMQILGVMSTAGLNRQ